MKRKPLEFGDTQCRRLLAVTADAQAASTRDLMARRTLESAVRRMLSALEQQNHVLFGAELLNLRTLVSR